VEGITYIEGLGVRVATKITDDFPVICACIGNVDLRIRINAPSGKPIIPRQLANERPIVRGIGSDRSSRNCARKVNLHVPRRDVTVCLAARSLRRKSARRRNDG
jgi:hypothetical protein